MLSSSINPTTPLFYCSEEIHCGLRTDPHPRGRFRRHNFPSWNWEFSFLDFGRLLEWTSDSEVAYAAYIYIEFYYHITSITYSDQCIRKKLYNNDLIDVHKHFFTLQLCVELFVPRFRMSFIWNIQMFRLQKRSPPIRTFVHGNV